MSTGVFDLTGTKRYYCGHSIDEEDFEISNSIRLRDLLIYPIDPTSNRQPYLQDYVQPSLEDIHQGGMHFSYNTCHFLANILGNLLDNAAYKQLNDYFYYQNGVLQEELNKIAPPISIDNNILLVSDDCDGETQEKILRACHIPRNKVFLLWRSVATFLGVEDFLITHGAQDGNKVAIVDERAGHVYVSILTIMEDDGFLVPCRKSFLNHDNYTVWNFDLHVPIPDDAETEFWKYTHNCYGRWVVPTQNGWRERDFPVPAIPGYIIPLEIANNIDFCIVIGDVNVSNIPNERLFHATGKDIATGAGRFAVRQANGLPTYFDQCEPLIFIVQDTQNETIVPVELIPGNEFCRGGDEIKGDINTNFYLEKANSSVYFLLNVGPVGSQTPLKELTHEFSAETAENQPLRLHPSMIPGQGIARVEVEAHPLLRENVLLDFLKMQLSIKTIASLQEKIPRSFPIDIPEVDADTSLWDRVNISIYLHTGIVNDSGMFAKTRWPNLGCPGIERFKRINVFGTNPQNCVPDVEENILQQLYQKIAQDYNMHHDTDDYIRLAAWTYQKDNPVFREMIADTMNHMRDKAFHYMACRPLIQEYTLCANMLSHQQQGEFFNFFNRRADDAFQRAQGNHISGVDHWLRALSGILMYNRDTLEDISTEICIDCAQNLSCILSYYRQELKAGQYVKVVITCLLFLLKRRRYDRGFLRDGDDKQNIIDECNNIRDLLFYQNIHPLCEALINFIEGHGTLEGIPAGNN